MKIFMDTANVDEIREFADMGIVYGVTTNPSLIAKSGRSQADVIPEICSLIPGPVSAEVISLDCAGMLEEAHKLVKIAENVVIKIPCNAEGLKAVKVLSSEGIRVNVTLIFSLPQALLAARAGAAYVSPFVGRLDDIGEDGVQLVADIVDVFRNFDIKTEVIAASIRSLGHVNAVTKVLRAMLVHPLTDKGIEKFLADYRDSQKR